MKTQPITDLANVISTQTGGVIPTQKPGVIYVPGRDQKTGQGDFVQLSDLRVGRIYDRVAMGTAITAGQEFQFFSNIGGKNLLQTNLQQDSQLPARWEMIVRRLEIYVVPRPIVPATPDESDNDSLLIQNSGYAEFSVGGSSLDQQGPVYHFPACKGSAGSGVSLDGFAAAEARGIVSNGAPGPFPAYEVPIYIAPQETIRGIIRFFVAQTLTAVTDVEMALYGWISRPLS